VEVAIVVLCSVSDVMLVVVLPVEVDEPKPEPVEVEAEAEAEAGGEPPDAVSDDPPVLIVVVLNCSEPVVVGKELAGAPVVTAVDVDWFSLAVLEAGDRLLGWVVSRFGPDEAALLLVSTPELTAGTELAPGLTDTDTSGEETDAEPDGETCNEDVEGVGICKTLAKSTEAELE
jgi:hypothetical protein